MKNRINVKFATEISILRTPEFKNGLSICMFSLCKRKASAKTPGPVLSKFSRNLCNFVYNRLGKIIYYENKLGFKIIYSIISTVLMFTFKNPAVGPFWECNLKIGVWGAQNHITKNEKHLKEYKCENMFQYGYLLMFL